MQNICLRCCLLGIALNDSVFFVGLEAAKSKFLEFADVADVLN